MLKGKKALITGGSRGIGRAIAVAMARNGADLCVLYSARASAAEETCAQAGSLGVCAGSLACDVSRYGEVTSAVSEAVRMLGGIDILVNNAGIVRDALLPVMREEDFRTVVETNLFGTWNMIRAASEYFLRRRSGRIINITSVSGLLGSPGQANYAAAKAGIVGLTKTVAREFASRGITCNAIAPGFIRTDMTEALPEERLRAVVGSIPMKRLGNPEDVAELAVFLAGGSAGYITGTVFCVDGGLSA